MKGSKAVIDLLNEVLAGELVAINQYFMHAKMLENWGYKPLADYVRKESIDEMKHAERLVERILYLEGLPNLQRLDKLHIGQTAIEQFKTDLQLEYDAVKRLNDGIAVCRNEGDATSERLLKDILASEEAHIDWLEAQLHLVREVGEQNYLAQQIRG